MGAQVNLYLFLHPDCKMTMFRRLLTHFGGIGLHCHDIRYMYECQDRFFAPGRRTTMNFQVWRIRDAVLERHMSLIDHIGMKRCNFLHDHYKFCHFAMWFPGSSVVLDCIDS